MEDIIKFETKLNDAKKRLRVSDDDIKTILEKRKQTRSRLLIAFGGLQKAIRNLNKALGGTDD